MTTKLQIPPRNVPVYGPDGTMTQPWYSFHLAMIDRAGGILGGLQPEDDTLTALAALTAAAGLLIQTGADAFAKRTITGSARIGVTNGSGAAGNPTIDTIGYSGTKTPPASITVVNGIVTNLT